MITQFTNNVTESTSVCAALWKLIEIQSPVILVHSMSYLDIHFYTMDTKV